MNNGLTNSDVKTFDELRIKSNLVQKLSMIRSLECDLKSEGIII